MEKAGKILRRSIHSFLQNYNYFTSTAVLLVFPFSVSVLLSQALVPLSASSTIYNRLRTLFDAAGFPPSSNLFSILNHKLSQTITCTIFTLPFTFTFFLVSKASVIQALNNHKPTLTPSLASIPSLYKPLLHTYLCNSIFILSANATAFSLVFFAYTCAEGIGLTSPYCVFILSAAGAVLYSVILANSLVVCNLALVLSGLKGRGGLLAILKACVLVRGRTSTALFLALPVNMAFAAIEALFHFRVLRSYILRDTLSSSMVLEGMFIAYLYSILMVLDTIVNYMFYRICKVDSWTGQDGSHFYKNGFSEEEDINPGHLRAKNLEELP